MYKRPFLGCAYYPEDWDESEIDHDIKMMKEAGITCARIGEFAWRKMEPKRGEYNFAWLHNVVNKLAENGISVILGTPTATPPIWLGTEHPDVFVTHTDGNQEKHGGRRHCCSSNENYLSACDAIVHAMGREFGDDPNVIGWQLDNEIYSWEPCICDNCVSTFHRYLENKYGTVENLNARWNLNLFSQAYDSFEQIPAPIRAWHNPHILLDWKVAHYEADIAFMHRQADILRLYTKAPIGTDMMPVNGMDYEAMTEKLDIVQFNHYNTPSNLHEETFWFNYIRTLKDVPFWNTETATTWNGAAFTAQALKPEGFCRVNSWLPVALGGEANMYWLWRQHWAGHELVHGSVLSPEGRPCHVFGEIQRTSAELEKASEFITETKVDSPVALHFTSRSWNLFDAQPIIHGLSYVGELTRVHRELLKLGVCPDVIGSKHTLDGYKVLVSPLLMTLEDNELSERIAKWVRDGGVWIAGPFTDIRNDIGAHFTDRAMGMLEEFLGVRLTYTVPTDGSYLTTEWNDGEALICQKNAELYDGVAEPLAAVTGGHSALIGKTVIGKIKVGKGEVILCGTFPSDGDIEKLYSLALKDAGVPTYKTEGLLTVVSRKGEEKDGLILCELGNAPASIVLDTPMTDILSGKSFDGKMDIEPYGIYVLTKADNI